MVLKPLLYKLWCIRKRRFIVSILELLLPIALFGILLYLKSTLHDSAKYVNATIFPGINKIDIITSPSELNKENVELVYSPDNDTNVDDVMNNVVQNILKIHTVSVVKFESETKVVKYLYNKYANQSTLGNMVFGIVFNKNLSYTLRPLSQSFQTSQLYSYTQGPGYNFNAYFQEGFLTLQILINDAIALLKSPSTLPLNFDLTEFPYPGYMSVGASQLFYSFVLPLMTMFGYYIMGPNLISNAVQEKNSGCREWMGMVGIPRVLILFSWILYCLPFYLFTTIVNSLMLVTDIVNGGSILRHTNFFYVWLLLFLFCTTAVIFYLAVTSFINNPNVALTFASILWLIPPVVLFNYMRTSKNIAYGLMLLSCIVPSCNVCWGFYSISMFESDAETITLSNLFKDRFAQPTVSLGLCYIFFIGSSIFYWFLYMYIDAVVPGKYGLARPWYFPFSGIYHLFVKKHVRTDFPIENKQRNTFEDVPNLTVGLRFKNIKKHFKKVVAVEDVSLDIYKGQITALLGHNGAGKTTLINIVTGMFSATKGEIWKDGENVFDDFSKFQRGLGLCPQHDLLFPYLNVKQHLMFFGMLRGLSWEQVKKESIELLKFFGISDKANCLSKKLSGGMKRKLSLAVSLIGNPEILILDEPTSGMDPESRRDIWDKLLSLRGERTIILTTHYMEEADVLGDMIAIMDHGQIKCYGTSLFLKKLYGSGYKLTVPLEVEKTVSQIVKSFISQGTPPSRSGPNLSFTLPLDKAHVFSEMFSTLEKSISSSKIGVTCTTLDDVFLKVAHIDIDEVDNMRDDEVTLLNDEKNDSQHSSSEALTPKQVKGIMLIQTRVFALIRKKVLYNVHRWTSWIFLNVFYPFVIFMIPIMLSSMILNSNLIANPSLSMDLDVYGETDTFLKSSSAYADISNFFVKLVTKANSVVHYLKESESVVNSLLELGANELRAFRYDYIISSDLSTSGFNMFFSSVATHSPGIAVNSLYNSWFSSLNQSIINVHNYPIKFEEDICSPEMQIALAGAPSGIWLFTAPTAIAVMALSFSRLHHTERITGGKLLQLMTGTSPILYWVSAFICDILLLSFTGLLILLCTYIFDSVKLFSSLFDYGTLFLIIMMSCSGCLWFGYLASYFLQTFSRLFSLNIFLAILFGQVAYFIITIVRLINPPGSIPVTNAFHHILMFYPSYCSSALIYKFVDNLGFYYMSVKCAAAIITAEERQPLFTWDDDKGINQELVYSACSCLLYATLILMTDYGFLGKLQNYIARKMLGPVDQGGSGSDIDVENERNNVEDAMVNVNVAHSHIIVDSLAKKYNRKLTAVKNISFLIPKGECFGLLGVNGAGKTTTFKMLTGALLPTSGQSIIFGDSLNTNRLKYQSHIGYCPQTDAIIEELTATEMLSLYTDLRGIHPLCRNKIISYWINEFGLQSVCNRSCGTYSGGNKRKLSTAISVIGDPQVIFLDEPTTGVDPVARRKFWAILSKLQKKGCTVVLTSHSMDECETVCDRLTIMVKGEMKCLGNIQRLKNLYGQGYTVLIQLGVHSEGQLQQLKSEINNCFSNNALIKDEHVGLLHYHIVNPNYQWSFMFSTMESIKNNSTIIKEYILTETTLEQIFLHFAKT